jgi:hypothetical protein
MTGTLGAPYLISIWDKKTFLHIVIYAYAHTYAYVYTYAYAYTYG